ncbi:MAG: TlpA family protein disulfide reductase [Verrucomicrobiales bacterium]|nr:TlpA family protein disulfide reductase [Verrucomicrobiales bacterium]
MLLLIAFVAYKLISGFGGGGSGVGGALPPITAKYLSGSKPYLKGKPAVIEFWATWCPPCRQSIPHLNGLYESSGGKLQIIGISQEDAGTITTFREDTKMSYSVAIDASGSLAKHFGVRGIPYAVLVDALGTVKWAGHPMELTAAKIQALLL